MESLLSVSRVAVAGWLTACAGSGTEPPPAAGMNLGVPCEPDPVRRGPWPGSRNLSPAVMRALPSSQPDPGSSDATDAMSTNTSSPRPAPSTTSPSPTVSIEHQHNSDHQVAASRQPACVQRVRTRADHPTARVTGPLSSRDSALSRETTAERVVSASLSPVGCPHRPEPGIRQVASQATSSPSRSRP